MNNARLLVLMLLSVSCTYSIHLYLQGVHQVLTSKGLISDKKNIGSFTLHKREDVSMFEDGSSHGTIYAFFFFNF